MINLISDTVTKPTPDMLKAMMSAEVGDDVFQQDPTVIALEKKVAGIFGKEAALYCPSGTMSNQLAIRSHLGALDEIICEYNSHIYQYETGAYAMITGAVMNLVHGENGLLTPNAVEAAIKPEYDWLPNSRLVVVENTCNRAGGTYYTIEQMRDLSKVAEENELIYHLDGARIFNALTESGDSPNEVGQLFDSISMCLSKGLGAPEGSVLSGSAAFIKKARKFRKALGGGMRQAGYLAAAGIYALDNHIDRLKEDHIQARMLADTLRAQPWVESIAPGSTNILMFSLKPPKDSDWFVKTFEEHGILCSSIDGHRVRLVTHLDVSRKMIEQVCSVIKSMD